MSDKVDDRVVGLKFDNAQFSMAIQATLDSLAKLNNSLKLDGATKGLADVAAAGRSVQLGHISSAVDDIAGHFKAMSVVAITALASITHQALATGTALIESLTIDPIKSGLSEYETNLNSIQTILANTQAAGVTLEDVNKALDELNHYADDTIYSFAEMAKNIGTFTAAGVALGPAVSAIKGIANLAALSGSNAEQAAGAMYQLSQAISAGTVKLIDWNSVNAAGIGGTVFQRALAQTAVTMGKLSAGAVTLDGAMQTVKINGEAFRTTLEQGWLTSDVLTATLSQFTSDLTDADLAAQGFSDSQIEAIQNQARTAKAAAVEVKTMTQLLGALREAAGSGWAQTWQLIFGNFTEAKALWSGVYNTLSGMVGNAAEARNQLLGDWKKLGGRDVLIEAIGNGFNAFLAVIKPIKDAFREIFPAKTAQDLYNITVALRKFTQNLIVGAETADKIKRTFAGVFAIFGIGYDIVARLVGILFHLFGMFADSDSNILSATASIGDFLVALRSALQTSEGIRKFFQNLEKILETPVKILIFLGHLLGDLFDNFDTEGAAKKVLSFTENLGPLGKAADFVVYAWEKMFGSFGKIWNFFEPLADKFVAIFKKVSDAVGGVNFGDLLAAINTGALVAFVMVLKNSFGGGGISGIMSELTETLSTMQTTLKATTLLEIALAVGILAISVSVLSNIDADKLTKALAAIAIMFTQLLASLAILTQLPGNNVVRLYVMAAAMTVLAVAIVILAAAVKMLSDLSWEELVKGLAGVVILLAAVTASAALLPDGARLISTGIGIIAIAVAIKILASAVQDLSGLDWGEMARGLVGVGAILAALTLFTRFAGANAGGVLAGAGLILLAVAIKILASAIQDISSISWENVGKGMAVLALSLALMTAALDGVSPTAPLQAAGIAVVAASMLILAEAMKSISGISWENVGKGLLVLALGLSLITAALDGLPPTAPLSAAGILIVAVAMTILADALKQMGSFSGEEIAKSLIVLGGALLIITVALDAMETALPGAAAVLVVAAAFAILAPVLKILGGMSWEEIGKGLLVLALALTIIGVAGYAFEGAIPGMLGLGAAIALIGLGLALAGAGVFLFATGLIALGVGGAVATAALVAMISAVIGLIPMFVRQVGIALLILLDILTEAIPKIVEFFYKLVVQILEGFTQLLPKIEPVIKQLITVILSILEAAIPEIYRAGLKILIGILEGIRDNIHQIVTTAVDVLEQFIKGIIDNLPDVIEAGVQLILAYIRGLTKAINEHSAELGDAGGDLAVAIIKGMTNGLWSGTGKVADAARGVAKSALNAAMKFLGINSPSKEFMYLGEYSGEGMALGFKNISGFVARAAASVGQKSLDAMKKSVAGLSSILAHDIDPSPVITPVIDLSGARKSAAELWNMMDTKPVSVDSSYSSARFAANGFEQNKAAADDNGNDPGTGDTIYNQYNNSPKTLSTAEIYRQTKNQLSSAKGGLPT